MRDGAERAGTLLERAGGGHVNAAAVDRDRDDGALVCLREPRDAERRVEPARESEHDGILLLVHGEVFFKC
jgi:hypothetical protein